MWLDIYDMAYNMLNITYRIFFHFTNIVKEFVTPNGVACLESRGLLSFCN